MTAWMNIWYGNAWLIHERTYLQNYAHVRPVAHIIPKEQVAQQVDQEQQQLLGVQTWGEMRGAISN